MGLIDDIKKEAHGNRTDISTNEAKEILGELNKLFFIERDIREETKFIKTVMTRGQETQERVGLHASAIIVSDDKFCYRQQVLSLFYKMSQGEHLPVPLKRIFEEGNAIHEKWQRLFIRAGYSDASRLDVSQFNEDYDLGFTPDIICDFPLGGKMQEMVVEIKSVNTYSFSKMTSHPSAKKQLYLYMYLTGIHKGFVLCDDKNTQDVKVFYYEYDEKEVKKYINRLKKVQEYKRRLIEKGKMVKRSKKCSSSDCKMASECNMRDACWNVGMGRVRI